MNGIRLITLALAVSFLLLSLPAATWAEPIHASNRVAYGTDRWLAYEPGLARESELDGAYVEDWDGYWRIANSAVELSAVENAEYYARIEAAAASAPQMPAELYRRFDDNKQSASGKRLTARDVQ